MSIFEQEKVKIVFEYSLSPRCLQSEPKKPIGHLYSWKNYLSSEVNTLFNKIRNQEEAYRQLSNNKTQPFYNRTEYEVRKYYEKIKNRRNERKTVDQDDKNKPDFPQFASRTPILQRSDRLSQSAGVGVDFNGKSDDKTTLSSLDMEFQGSKGAKDSIKEDNHLQEKKRQDITLRSQIRRRKQRMEIEQQKQQEEDMLNLYHLRLKQQQRLYLLRKFMDHYEQTHKFKL